MNDWTSGYVADIGYTHGYYPELSPLRARLALLNKGIVCPEFKNACELGFGQGLSVNVHAAASSVNWYGTDFNPSQAAYAQELAGKSGASAKLYDEAFADFAARQDLPDFDFICLHGIWSWISDENRSVIVDFVRKKLAVGGVLYISYNTFPGWAAFAPMRHLLTEHAEVIGSQGRGIVSKVDDAIVFAEKLLQTNPLYSRANPQIAERIKKIKEQNRHYLAHEYFNKDWHPMHFAALANWLEPAKVQFASSANYLDSVDSIHLTPEQQKFLEVIPDSMFRESVRDFMINQQFRRDYWVKGMRTLPALEQIEQIREIKVLLTLPHTDVPLKVTGALGDAEMSPQVYGPILDALSDHKVRTIAHIEKATRETNIQLNQLVQAILILAGNGSIQLVQDEKEIQKARKSCDALNRHLKNIARSGNESGYLASPVVAGSVNVNRFQQLFLLAIDGGLKHPEEWAKYVWQILSAQGQRILKDGKTLESPEENLAELMEQAKTFAAKSLPIMNSLQLV